MGSLLYFSTYEYLKVQFTPQGEERPNFVGTLGAGGVAGIMNWIVALPIDVLKTRLQIAPEGVCCSAGVLSDTTQASTSTASAACLWS